MKKSISKSKNIDKQFLEVLEVYFNQNIDQAIDAGCEFSSQEIERLIKNSSNELNKNIALIVFLFFGSLILVGIFFSKFSKEAAVYLTVVLFLILIVFTGRFLLLVNRPKSYKLAKEDMKNFLSLSKRYKPGYLIKSIEIKQKEIVREMDINQNYVWYFVVFMLFYAFKDESKIDSFVFGILFAGSLVTAKIFLLREANFRISCLDRLILALNEKM